jgi:hypothetical protein
VRTLLVILLVLAIAAPPLAAQRSRNWQDLYRDAIALVSKQQWKAAEDTLLQAVKAGPPSGRGQIKRALRSDEDYFPEFYLGVIYLNTNRPVDAQIQFQVARKRGIDLGEREFQRLPEYEARAKELADAEAKTRAAADRGAQFKTLLGQAQRAFTESRYDDAESAVRQALALNLDNTTANALLQNIARARASTRLQDALKRNPGLAELRRLLTEYADSGVNLDEVRRRIDAAEAVARRDTAERAAMIAYYNGQYTQSINALNEAEKALALSARGQFYRAVALATQATRGKVVNQGLLNRARQAWQQANQTPDAFKADLRYISPQILQLLRGS